MASLRNDLTSLTWVALEPVAGEGATYDVVA